jgi:hypothetical protein
MEEVFYTGAEPTRVAVSCRVVSGKFSSNKTLFSPGNDLKSEHNQRVNNIYIFMVHTVVLLQCLSGYNRPTQHVNI